MNTNPTFLTEINTEIDKLHAESVEIEIKIQTIKKDKKLYKNHFIATKAYYQLLMDKFNVALKKAKFESIRDGREYTYRNHIRPVYLHKIDQFSQFKYYAPEVLFK